MTTTEIEFIPSCFWAALDAQPECLTLRSAIVDALLEAGDEEANDCLKWTIAKRRVPDKGGWTSWRSDTSHCIPMALYCAGKESEATRYLFTAPPETEVSTAFRRLIWRWKHTTPEQRVAFWEWEPQ